MPGTAEVRIADRFMRRWFAPYLLALAFSALATAVEFAIWPLTGRIIAFTYYAAILGSAWFGIGPGLLSLVLSAIAVQYFWTPPIYSLAVAAEELPWFAAFIGCAIMTLAWSTQRRRAHQALKSARDLLEETVAQRTAELVEANAALRREIAERLAAEEELQEAQAEVARTLRLASVAETAAAIAHEINQPLAAIGANASACLRSLSRDPPMMELAQEAAGCIVSDADRVAQVTARVRALLNKEGPTHIPVEVNQLIEDGLALSRAAIERQAIAVRTELASSLPPVSGDPVQLQQVLLNLVTNGIEAMADAPEGTRTLIVRSWREEGGVAVAVEDTGGGIEGDQAGRVFDSFYTTKPNGIGVGLSISRSIIEAHGGRLWLASPGPRGARFSFILPVADTGPARDAGSPRQG